MKVSDSPKVMAPRLSALTRRPLFPRLRSSMGRWGRRPAPSGQAGCPPRLPGSAAEPRQVRSQGELPRGAVRAHVADLAEDGPLGAPGAIIAAEDPEDARVGVGVPAV